MPQITYHGQVYTVNAAFNLTFSHEGDKHGNNNIFSATHYPSAYQALKQIAPLAADMTLAVRLDGQAASLDTKIRQDCTLDSITLQEPLGRLLRNRSCAFLIACATNAIAPQALLTECSADEIGCHLAFTQAPDDFSSAALMSQFHQLTSAGGTLSVGDAWQKALLLENYPSLNAPYAQKRLAAYDDFDFVPTVIYGSYALPCAEAELFALLPHICADALITCTLNAGMLTISAHFSS